MKKYINIAFIYGLLSLISGVIYREVTKFSGFEGKTSLSSTHFHLFVLGTIMFLIIGLFSLMTNLEDTKNFKKFMITYNIALPFMVIMFYARGFVQVFGTEVSKGLNASISGLSGIAHILMAVGIYFLYSSLKNICKK